MRGETITGIRAGGEVVIPVTYDEQGNPAVTVPASYQIKNCMLAPGGAGSSGSSENAEPYGTVAITRVQVIVLRSVPDVRATDIIQFWGKDWQVDGLVGPWTKGRLFGSVFIVKRAS